jgi:hypothetical protein
MEGQARGKDGKFKDPLEERLNKFEQERADEKRQAAERADARAAHRKTKSSTSTKAK